MADNTSAQPIARNGVACGACQHFNNESAQFCAGCGQALFEPCGKCSQSVRLEQKFCGGCGTDLQQKRERVREQYEQWLTSAVEAARLSDFERALGQLGRVAEDKDYRYAELSRQANVAIEKINKLKTQRTAAVESLVAQAEVALANEDRSAVVELLSRVPEAMRSPEMRQMLESCSMFVARLTELEQTLQKQLVAKDYEGVAGTIEVLLGLVPNSERYTKVARQVAEKLLASSQRRFDKQDYTGAASKLSAVPSQMRDGRYESARQLIENVEWLEKQFVAEPLATSTLGRLAVRFEKESPQNERAVLNTKELLQTIKQPYQDPRQPFNPWRGTRESWIGGKASYLGYPTSIPGASDETLRRNPGRFAVAIGLALQGLGLGLVSEGFAVKKARFAVLASKKPKTAWGIDVGTSGIRAVLLQLDKEELTVLDSYYDEFDAPTSRIGNETTAADTIRQAITKFLESSKSKELESSKNKESAYWVNLPAGEIIARFVRLPPVKDKKAEELMEMERVQRIPMPPDILEYVGWIGANDADSAHGRAAFVCAAKKAAIAARTDLLASAGMKISGMQCDQVALVNFAAREFAESFKPVDDDKPTMLPTVAILDSGATFTSLLLISQESFWFWSLENGGEDLTTALARGTKSVHRDAEELKRFPAKIDRPRDGYEPVEKRLEEFRARLQKLVAEGLNQNGRFDVVETWCMGGSPMTHSWIRRVLLKE